MEGLYRSVLNAALDAIITADIAGDIIDFNPAAERTFGFTKEEIVGRSLSDTIVPIDLRAAHDAGMEHWRQTGEGPVLDKRIEVPAMRKNGEVFPAELTVTAVSLTGGESAFAAYIRDLSEVRAVEEKLRLSEFSLERLGDAIFWIDRTARLVRVNAAACDALGYERDELLDMTVFDIDAVMTPALWKEHWRELGHRKTFSLRSQHRHKSGRVFPVDVSVNYIEHGEDAINCVIVRDISEQDRVDEELRRARDVAEAANAAKSEFLAKISHDIRTPLNAVLGFADLLSRSGKLAPSEIGWVDRITGNSHYLLDLVSDLLDLSKIEAGHLVLEPAPTDIRSMVADLDSTIRPQALDKSLGFQIEARGDVPDRVLTDGLRLRQVLLNLLGNAIKYTERGEITLRVSWQVAGEKNGRLSFDVQDTGVGISPTHVREIFEPFRQLNRSPEGLGGVGLGLNISRRLVQLLGGRIEVESRRGEGSVFSVNLGVELAAGATLGPLEIGRGETRVPRPVAVGGDVLLGRRFLLVDDSPDNRDIVRFLLEGAGSVVEEAENGRVALEAIEASHVARAPFDIVLMDMQMPILDGYRATEELRRRGRDDIVIAMTAAVMDDERRRCLEVGCDSFIPKPVVPEHFFREIERILKGGVERRKEPRKVERMTGGHEHLGALIEKYRRGLPTVADELERGFATQDNGAIETSAHRIKGTGAAYGFPEITRQAGEVEAAIREQRSREVLEPLLRELVALLRRIAQEED